MIPYNKRQDAQIVKIKDYINGKREYVTGEGTSITLENTANTPFNNIILKGNTSQQQYSGINLLNNDIDNTTLNGITIQHDDNSVTINGTNTGYAFRWNFKNNITFKANTNYTAYIKVISGNFKPFTSNADWAVLFYIENSAIPINNKSSNFIRNFTPTEDIEVLPYFWFGWDSNSVQGQDGIFNNFKLQIMIVEGNYTSSTIPSFEPYVGSTASPNPDYPQDIKVVTGNNTIKISNKNLLNGTHQTTITINGITITSNSDDTFDITGISTSETSFGLITNIDQSNLVVGKTYYFYMSEKYDGQNLNVSLITNTPSLRYWMANASTTIQEGQKYNNLILYVPKGVTMNYHNIKFMINEGSTAIDYVPYKQQVFPISLGSLELCKIGDYQDYIYKKDNKWYKHKMIKKTILNGTEKWTYYDELKVFFTNDYEGEFASSLCFSNFFIKKNFNGNNGAIAIGNPYHSSYQTLHLTNWNITTLSDWKNWLSNNKPIVYFTCYTPTEEEITDTTLINQLDALEQAVSYDDITNISQTNANLPFIINVEAVKKLL